MHRGHAAQRREAQVERLPGRRAQCWYQGYGNVGGVRNHTDPVQPIQLSRLGGNVRTGEVQAAVAGQWPGQCLRNDLAMALGLEPVNHDPVVTGKRLNLVHTDIEQCFQRRGCLQVAQYPGNDSGLPMTGFHEGLQLDYQHIVGTLQRGAVVGCSDRQFYRVNVWGSGVAVRMVDEGRLFGR